MSKFYITFRKNLHGIAAADMLAKTNSTKKGMPKHGIPLQRDK